MPETYSIKKMVGVLLMLICFQPAVTVAGSTDREVETVNRSVLENEIKQDIEELHAFFVGWYNGNLPESAFDEAFVARLGTEFTIVMPSGKELDYDTLSSAMRESFGKNPGFRIVIRNVRLIHSTETTAIASYEEWQHLADEGTESGSGRVSTVIFSRGDRLKWLRVHETWLPEE